MTVDQLHDAIGMLPADLLAQTDQKRGQKPKVFPIRRYAALAASAAVILWGVWMYRLVGVGPGKAAPAGNTAKTEGTAQNSPGGASWDILEDSDSSPETAAEAVQSQAVSGSLLAIPALELRWGSSAAVLSPDRYDREEDAGNASSNGTYAESRAADPDAVYTLTPDDGPLLLHWSSAPEEVTACCWREQELEPIPAEIRDGALILPAGDWFCRITARWSQGTAAYTFRVNGS